uniref:Uncharacterized protein n=1 Tax=Romanomermis culicivorax TaxID=13658 RepID=A0A915JXP1_ROMCU
MNALADILTVLGNKWTTPGVSIDVCTLPRGSKKYSYCQTTVSSTPNPAVMTLPASYTPFQITLTASEFVRPPGGIAIVDNISYKAAMCVPTTTAGTTRVARNLQMQTTPAITSAICDAVQCNYRRYEAFLPPNTASVWKSQSFLNENLLSVRYKFLDDCSMTVYKVCIDSDQNCPNSISTSGKDGQWTDSTFNIPKGTRTVVQDVR